MICLQLLRGRAEMARVVARQFDSCNATVFVRYAARHWIASTRKLGIVGLSNWLFVLRFLCKENGSNNNEH